jgi:hypothetical protein
VWSYWAVWKQVMELILTTQVPGGSKSTVARLANRDLQFTAPCYNILIEVSRFVQLIRRNQATKPRS